AEVGLPTEGEFGRGEPRQAAGDRKQAVPAVEGIVAEEDEAAGRNEQWGRGGDDRQRNAVRAFLAAGKGERNAEHDEEGRERERETRSHRGIEEGGQRHL